MRWISGQMRHITSVKCTIEDCEPGIFGYFNTWGLVGARICATWCNCSWRLSREHHLVFERHEVDDLSDCVDHFGVRTVVECAAISSEVTVQEGRLLTRLWEHVVYACSLMLTKATGVWQYEAVLLPGYVDHFGASIIEDCGQDVFGCPNTWGGFTAHSWLSHICAITAEDCGLPSQDGYEAWGSYLSHHVDHFGVSVVIKERYIFGYSNLWDRLHAR
jgi:hypothetical protein